MIDLHHGDCLDIMPTLEADSVDAIVTDPPYYNVKGEAWDRQWNDPDHFIEWLDRVLAECYRILRPNGSLYLFAWPKMAARVELAVGRRFNVLNNIVWYKSTGNRNWSTDKTKVRAFLPNTERIIFAEHYGSDGYAKGEAGYVQACDELRGFVFEPLRAYLAGERDRAGLTTVDIAEQWRIKTGNRNRTGMARHWFEQVQWALPTRENYEWLRQTFSRLNHGGEYLRREYEDLRREYEDLRRPFNISADVPYTDVWSFKTVQAYPGKHPTEKPLDLMSHMIAASTRPGAVVLDPFMGSGSTGIAALMNDCDFIGIEQDADYIEIARRRIEHWQAEAERETAQLELQFD